MKIGLTRPFILLTLFAALIPGCQRSDPNLGYVTGTVLFNGEPLPNATVIFAPLNPEARGSSGITDEKGEFVLASTQTQPGIPQGEYRIAIKSDKASEESFKDPLLPKTYNAQTELVAAVGAGKNHIRFELTSDGAIPKLSGK